MRPMSTGIDPSMFFVGTVTVMNASLPERCAWIIAIGAGMRTMGASGGPLFPHPVTAKAARMGPTHEVHEDLRNTKYKRSYFVAIRLRPPPSVQPRATRFRSGAPRGGPYHQDGSAGRRR